MLFELLATNTNNPYPISNVVEEKQIYDTCVI